MAEMKVRCKQDYVEGDECYWTAGREYECKMRDGNYEIETNLGNIGVVGEGYVLDNFDEYFERV